MQNRVWKSLTGGTEDIFTEEEDITFATHNSFETVTLQKAESAGANDVGNYVSYEFTAQKDGPIYFYNHSTFAENFGTSEDVLKYLGTYEKGDRVYGLIGFNETVTEQSLLNLIPQLYFGYEDREVLTQYATALKQAPITIAKENDAHLTGEVTASDAKRLFFTIPYNKGWTLYVDGQETSLQKTGEIFMSAEISAGDHTYEMVYFPPGLSVGMLLSLLSVIVLLVLTRTDKRKKV